MHHSVVDVSLTLTAEYVINQTCQFPASVHFVRVCTLRSVPEDLRRAQSSGECPGSNTTFCRGLFCGGRVETDGARLDDVVLLSRGRIKDGGGIDLLSLLPSGRASFGGGRVGEALGVVWSSSSLGSWLEFDRLSEEVMTGSSGLGMGINPRKVEGTKRREEDEMDSLRFNSDMLIFQCRYSRKLAPAW